MRPMTIVVVREEPAGGSGAGVAAAVAAGAADAVVAGSADAAAAGAVPGAEAAVAGEAAAVAGGAGLAVVWAKPVGAARRSAARTAGSARRRFMPGETIGRAPTRQAFRVAP